jgi:hypothetical protein
MRLCDALRRAVGHQEAPTQRGRARQLPDIVEAFGGTSELVSWLAGTDRRSSKEYRSAARRIQRYRQGTRRPNAPTLRRLRAEASRRASRTRQEARRERLPVFGDGVKVAGIIRVSKDRRRRAINGAFHRECWEGIIAALDADDCEEAEELFSECFGEANHFGAAPEFEDVDSLEPAI